MALTFKEFVDIVAEYFLENQEWAINASSRYNNAVMTVTAFMVLHLLEEKGLLNSENLEDVLKDLWGDVYEKVKADYSKGDSIHWRKESAKMNILTMLISDEKKQEEASQSTKH